MLGTARLLVWEHRDSAALVQRLRALGCVVTECASVEQAIVLHQDKPFDLILACPGRGEGDILGVLRLLRRALTRTPLVLVSPEDSVELRLRCQPLHPQYFATLPLDEGELRAILQLVLGPPQGGEAG